MAVKTLSDSFSARQLQISLQALEVIRLVRLHGLLYAANLAVR